MNLNQIIPENWYRSYPVRRIRSVDISLDNTSNNADHSPDRRHADGEEFKQVIVVPASDYPSGFKRLARDTRPGPIH